MRLAVFTAGNLGSKIGRNFGKYYSWIAMFDS